MTDWKAERLKDRQRGGARSNEKEASDQQQALSGTVPYE